MEVTRDRNRRELLKAHNMIDGQRERLNGKIERQLQQRQSVERLFVLRWDMV